MTSTNLLAEIYPRLVDDLSELYADASSGSEAIWRQIGEQPSWPSAVAALESCGAPTEFAALAELEDALGALRNVCRHRLENLSEFHQLPRLCQAVSDVYLWRERPMPTTAVVVPAKTLAVRLGQTSASSRPDGDPSIDALISCMELAFVEYQLQVLAMAWSISPSAWGRLTPDGIITSPGLNSIMDGFNYAFAAGGRVGRFSGRMIESLFRLPGLYLTDVMSILDGQNPDRCSLVGGTVLGRLPGASQATPFWCCVAARLYLLDTAKAAAAAANRPLNSIAVPLIGEPAMSSLPMDVRRRIRHEIARCVWNSQWLGRIATGSESHDFLSRPVARLTTEGRCLYVTSAVNIADSLSQLFELALGPAQIHEDWKLPKKVQQEVVSEPFEDEVIEAFRSAGYLAGGVTKKGGAWKTQNGVLTGSGLGEPPGQIDLLAWREPGDLIVGECKVLQLPRSSKQLQSVWSNIAPGGKEKFHGMARRNGAWARQLMVNLGRPVETVRLILILDRGLHLLSPYDDVEVTDLELIRQRL